MRHMIALFLIFCLLFSFSDAFSQLSRKNQFEIYAGVGIPLSPKAEDIEEPEFWLTKDYHKVGLSLNLQYVVFATPRLGIPISVGFERFTFNSDAFSEDFSAFLEGEVVFYDPNSGYTIWIDQASSTTTGSASTFKFGAGIRPYLTSPEASTQFFLFGQASYNILKSTMEFESSDVTLIDSDGDEDEVTITASDLSDIGFDPKLNDFSGNNFGIAGGLGIEIPAGGSFNLIFQGLYNIIFTEGNSTSFMGITAGIVF